MEYTDITDFEEINITNDAPRVKVTVLCNTYNQEDYLVDALESFLHQETEEPYEILIFDDASTDETSNIIREYARRYPRIIKAFIARKNTYTHPLRKEMKRVWFKRFARGEYVAFCEGDDFWIDDKKLENQSRALDEHPECDMCACWGCTVTEDGKKEVSQIRPRESDGILSVEEVILGGGQYLVTSGQMCRRILLEKFSKFENNLSLDYVTQIKGALRGGIYYIDHKMAAYRRYSKNSWTMRVLRNKDRLNEQWELEKAMLISLDRETDYKYHAVITERLLTYVTFYEQLLMKKEEIEERLQCMEGRKYMWGLGRRGTDFEVFCKDEGIKIAGVCDITNDHVGEKTAAGNMIMHTDSVLENAEVILATNTYAYEDIIQYGYKGKLINLQEFMPYG